MGDFPNRMMAVAVEKAAIAGSKRD